MPDPLTVIGGVAALVQLGDAAAKLAHEIYAFLRAIRSAGHDAQRQLSIIEDLKGALGLLSSYTTANHTTQTPAINDGLTKLTATLQDICNDLKCIRALIPLGPHIGASAKMRWTLRRKEIDSKLRDIESRKTTLLVTLEFLSMQHQKVLLCRTHDVETAIKGLQLYANDNRNASATIRDALSLLSSEISALRSGQERTLRDIADAIPREADTTRFGMRRIEDKLSDHEAMIGGWMSAQMQLLQDVNEALPQETSRIENRLSGLIRVTSLTNSPPCTTTSSYDLSHKSEHVITRIAREEIHRAMHPILESLSQAQVRHESLVEALKNITEDLSMRLWDVSLHDEEFQGKVPNTNARTTRKSALASHLTSYDLNVPSRVDPQELDYTNCSIINRAQRETPKSGRKYHGRGWSYWTTFSWLGTIRIEIRPSKKWGTAKSRWIDGLAISVNFWPSWPLLRRRCVSLLYPTEPSHSIYHQILPKIATFPVVSKTAPVWHLICRNDVRGLRHALVTGLANPNDQDENGVSLLYRAVEYCNIEACTMLLAMGAEAEQITKWGESPVQLFIARCWLHLLLTPECACNFSRDAIFPIAHALLDGRDLEDIYIDPALYSPEGSTCLDGKLWRRYPDNLDVLAEWSSWLSRRGKRFQDWFNISHLIEETFVPIEKLLACGMNPNYDKDPWQSPIFSLLYRLINLQHVDWGDDTVDDLTDLISAGADIYVISMSDMDLVPDAFPGSPIVTPTMFAIDRQLEHFWKLALRRAGFHPAKVYAKDERRRRAFLRRQGATSSGVEPENLSAEESSLRLRNCNVYNEDGRWTCSLPR